MKKPNEHALARSNNVNKTNLARYGSETGNLLNQFQSLRHKIHHIGDHTGKIQEALITSDGHRVITASDDCTAKLWDMNHGRCLMTYEHPDGVNNACTSADGKYVITTTNNKARVFEIETGNLIQSYKLTCPTMSSRTKVMSSGNYMFAASSHCLDLWDIVRQKHLYSLERKHGYGCTKVTISPDGQYVCIGRSNIVGRSDSDHMALIDVNTNKVIREFHGHEKSISFIEVLWDLSLLITASGDETMRLWYIRSGVCIQVFEGHQAGVCTFSVTSNRERLVSASWDKTARLWDMRTGRCLKVYKGHKASICSLSISNDSKLIVTGSLDNTCKIWKFETGELLRTLEGHAGAVLSVSLSPDKKHVVTKSADHRAKIWEVETGVCKQTIPQGEIPTLSIHSIPASGAIVTQDASGTMKITSLSKEIKKHTLSKDGGSGLIPFCLSPQNDCLIFSNSNIIQLWDYKTWQHIKRITVDIDRITALAVNQDGSLILVGSLKGAVHLLSFQDSKKINTLQQHQEHNSVNHICSWNEGLIAAASQKRFTVWKIKEDQSQIVLDQKAGWITSLKCIYGTNYLIVEHQDKVQFWDVSSQCCVKEVPVINPRICVNIDSQWVLIIGYDLIGTIIDCQSFDTLRTIKFQSLTGWIISADISQDGKRVIGLTSNHRTCIWDITDGSLLGVIHNLDRGFLWTTPPDNTNPRGWFWTDRKDLVCVYEESKDSCRANILEPNDQRFEDYFTAHNRPDMVITRINNPEKYRMLCEQHSQIVSMEIKKSRYELKSADQKKFLPGSNIRESDADD